jgi:AcrR family transcriptional regulator
MSNAHLLITMQKEKKFIRNKEEKIKLIYKTFFDLLQKKGYSKLSTNHIAKAANIAIGTIYLYFPGGKAAIATDYFEEIKNKIIDDEFLIQIKNKNPLEVFEYIISKNLKVYRDNREAFLAYEQAILSNKELFKNYQDSVYKFGAETAKNIRKENKSYQDIPEERFIKSFLLIYNLIEALTRRHITIFPLFETDKDLVNYLTSLILFTMEKRQNQDM